MKSYPSIRFTILIVLFFSTNVSSQETNEFIRYKIENRNIVPITVENDWILCPSSLAKIYENRIFSLAWNNKNAIDQLIKSIEAAELEGLNPKNYHLENLLDLHCMYFELNYLQKAHLDLLATDAFLLLTSDLLLGKVNPTSIDKEWYINRREENQVLLLEKAIEDNNIHKIIEESIPKHKIYLGLKEALAKYQQIKIEGDWEQIPEGATLKKGIEDDRIVLVKKRLLITNDLDSVGNAKLFDKKLKQAVELFQKRHNLDIDGNIGKATISAMNVCVDARIDQIKANLERWRWLAPEFSDYFIIVNIANFSIDIFKDGKNTNQYKAIVGKNQRETPVFSSKVSYLVLNPTWTVPSGIIIKDIIPSVKKNVNYLKKKRLTITDYNGNVMDPDSIDWNSSAAIRYTYRQPAGPNNALGRVKFMFPNKHSIYLHDTPNRNLFERTERSFSSGCIRVQNPLQLAEFLISDSTNWSLKKIKELIKSKETKTISLKEQPDIHILYWTAWMDKDGIVQFRKDIYNRDFAISEALKAAK